ncbi:MAG: UvrD-helicase domain-containing protein, partial [Limnochordia bacterium]
MRWTQQQWAAITTRGRNILVAAGAGAGKTAVLVERIIGSLLDAEAPVDLDRLVVVTFTEAAAAQMRERIGEALEGALPDNPHLYRQLALLPKANISTIHAFCARLLRRYFYQLNLDPSFRILDGQEAELLKTQVLDELLETEYDQGSTAFQNLVDAYGGRTDENLRKLIRQLYEYATSLPQPEAW